MYYKSTIFLFFLVLGICTAAIDDSEYSRSWLWSNSVEEYDDDPTPPAPKPDPAGRDTDYTYKSVCIVDGVPTVIDGFDCRYQVAVGRYKNAINLTGWSYLEVETKPEADPDMQAYSAGLLEGILTKPVLELHLQNVVYDYCNGYKIYCAKLKKYLADNLAYVQQKLERAPRDDPYWQAVKRAYLQMTGVWHGFSGAKFNVSIDYSLNPIFMVNSKGDFYELETLFNRTKDPSHDGNGGRCSGLVKIAPDNSDILFSQVTMCGFESLLRVLKLYKYGYDRELYPGHTITMSSYPGVLYSADDFALLSSGLAALETTMKIFNYTVLKEIKPKGVLHCWVRTIVANQMARNGREWCHIFKRYNSGTYNNQWLVVDYSKFQPGKQLPDYGVLYVLEQMPSLVLYQDLTQLLKEKSYFASYNIPFFKRVSVKSGFEKMGNKTYWFNWATCPRAKMFERNHTDVVDIDTLTKLMRYNDYTHDKLSLCKCTPPYTAEAAISARGDLNPKNGTWEVPGMGFANHAALDYKGTNYAMFKKLQFRAWSGPTYDNVPVFDWRETELAETVKHFGQPMRWDFKPVDYQWETPMEEQK